jgi:hypothetical protein
MFTQLNPNLPVHVLDRGDGYAIGVIDYGPEHNLIWVTVLNENGEVWCAPNPVVRFGRNWTMGRAESSQVEQSKARSRSSKSDEGLCATCTEHAIP